MDEGTVKRGLAKVFQIDEGKIRDHLGEMVQQLIPYLSILLSYLVDQ